MTQKFNSLNFFVACGEIYYFSDVAEYLITCNICKNENFENFPKFSQHLTVCFHKHKLRNNKVVAAAADSSSDKENEDANAKVESAAPNAAAAAFERREAHSAKKLKMDVLSTTKTANIAMQFDDVLQNIKLNSDEVDRIDKIVEESISRNECVRRISVELIEPTLITTETEDSLTEELLQPLRLLPDTVLDKVPDDLLEQVLSLEDETSQKSNQLLNEASSICLRPSDESVKEVLLESLISSIPIENNRLNPVKNDVFLSPSTLNAGSPKTTAATQTDDFGSVECARSQTNEFVPALDSVVGIIKNCVDINGNCDFSDNNNNETELCHVNSRNNSDKMVDSDKLFNNDLMAASKTDKTENLSLARQKHELRKRKSKKDSQQQQQPPSDEEAKSKETFKCEKCDDAFKNVHGWLKHLRNVHNIVNPYKCDKCPKEFSQHSRLKVHQRIHTGEKPFSCSFCDRKFCQQSHKQRHERTHTGEKPYVCKVCGKSFTHPESLKAHDVTHLAVKPSKTDKQFYETHIDEATGRPRFTCIKCKESFPQLSCFKLHYGKSHAAKRFTCNDCGKSFNFSSNLTVHRRLHDPDTGKRLKCSKCDRMFRQLGHLRRHEQTHIGIKRYKCHICEKHYMEAKDLRNHLQRHSDVRFDCDLCPRWYKLEYDLKRHKNRSHMNFESLQSK